MTEQQYKDLLIATAKMSDYEYKGKVVDALKIASISFQKEWAFTRHLPNHRQEYIIISVVPDKLNVLKEHKDFVDDLCKQVYEPNDYNEYSGLVLKPGIFNVSPEEVSQEIFFDDIQTKIIDEIRKAKFSIWIAMAWFTNKKIFDELLKKRNEGLDVKIIIDNNSFNQEKTSFTLEDHFEVYWVDVMSERYKNIMHRKFCVIDLEVAMHGTFNWTNAANYNKEHWDVDHNRETAKTFAEEFVKMRRDAELSMLRLDFCFFCIHGFKRILFSKYKGI